MALLCCGLAALLPSCSDSDGVGTLVPGTGSIELSESNIALSDTIGSTAPAPRTVEITSGDEEVLGDLSVGEITFGDGSSGWVTAALSGNVTPATAASSLSPLSTIPG